MRIAKVALDTLCEDEATFTSRILKEVQTIDQEALKENASGKTLRKATRSIQAALNTISVDRTVPAVDLFREKIKAIVPLAGLTVSESTEGMKAENGPQFADNMQEQMKRLPPGIYLLRIIEAADNHKLEVHGHTTLYIKQMGRELYFDTQLGFYDLARKTDAREPFVPSSILSAKTRFQVDLCKFHKLELRREA